MNTKESPTLNDTIDSDGNYSLSALSSGNYTLVFKEGNYHPRESTIPLFADKLFNADLVPTTRFVSGSVSLPGEGSVPFGSVITVSGDSDEFTTSAGLPGVLFENSCMAGNCGGNIHSVELTLRQNASSGELSVVPEGSGSGACSECTAPSAANVLAVQTLKFVSSSNGNFIAHLTFSGGPFDVWDIFGDPSFFNCVIYASCDPGGVTPLCSDSPSSTCVGVTMTTISGEVFVYSNTLPDNY